MPPIYTIKTQPVFAAFFSRFARNVKFSLQNDFSFLNDIFKWIYRKNVYSRNQRERLHALFVGQSIYFTRNRANYDYADRIHSFDHNLRISAFHYAIDGQTPTFAVATI